ncbi:heterokaryon incompatibility protein-domain-containing protein [Echria macrotheca]|uniref:Heterokaryon incompatibility protein-domain-containing protein n=1 Tax=Echria macrotheca TaxID=438768 RepID=A0AAJ0BJ79_9PEZI|nr:heterokaryon incompatibility protein-domain-containing protein [Echria macrotheca]
MLQYILPASWTHADKLNHLPFLPGLDEIRLLELTTATSGRLFNIPRNSCSRYFAISYAWGDPTPVAPYTVNQRKILIPRSLSQALTRIYKYIRKSTTEGEVYVWVDALCINQNDNDEKAAQVARMSSVYQNSAKVLVHLGQDGYGKESEAAIATIRSWGHWTKDDFNRNWWEDGRFSPLTNNVALRNFFSRPWWSRVWTIQEVAAKSSPHITILSGDREIEWSLLAKALAFWLDRESMIERLGDDVDDAISDFLKGGLAAKIAIGFVYRADRHKWLSVLAATTQFASTDPRDKIYALVDICPPLPNFLISYEKPTDQVFRDFTEAMIEHCNNLEILQFAGVNHKPSANPHNLPSWVPNFEHLDHPIFPYPNMLNTRHSSKHMSNSFKIWNASPYPHSLEPPSPISSFRPKGMQVGAIAEVLPPVPGAGGDPGWLYAAYRRFGTQYDTPMLKCHILQAYIRTILGDYYANANQKLMSYTGRFGLAGTFWHKHRAAWAPLLQKMDLSGGLDEILLGQKGSLTVQFGDHDREVTRATREKWRTLHFFMTKNGYMGYGPSCRAGDVVCIIFGCSVPLVLRPEGQGFVILGQCFVLGVMDGELFGPGPGDVELVEGDQVFDIL